MPVFRGPRLLNMHSAQSSQTPVKHSSALSLFFLLFFLFPNIAACRHLQLFAKPFRQAAAGGRETAVVKPCIAFYLAFTLLFIPPEQTPAEVRPLNRVT